MSNLSKKSFLNSPFRSIKHTNYFHAYDHFFSKYRNEEITFVEIGVLAGGSLFMWRDFFGPKARIIGIDIHPNAKKWETEGFEIFIGSQSDESFWSDFKKKVNNIDIVLDDGGHTYEQQIVTVESLLEAMNDNGIIVTEDTNTSYEVNYGPVSYSFINYVKNRIDAVNRRFKFEPDCLQQGLSNNNNEKRFYSIEIVDSMVAFKINREASYSESEEIDNEGKDDLVSHINYGEDFTKPMFRLPQIIFWLLKLFPFYKSAVRFTKEAISKKNFSAKKYFK